MLNVYIYSIISYPYISNVFRNFPGNLSFPLLINYSLHLFFFPSNFFQIFIYSILVHSPIHILLLHYLNYCNVLTIWGMELQLNNRALANMYQAMEAHISPQPPNDNILMLAIFTFQFFRICLVVLIRSFFIGDFKINFYLSNT